MYRPLFSAFGDPHDLGAAGPDSARRHVRRRSQSVVDCGRGEYQRGAVFADDGGGGAAHARWFAAPRPAISGGTNAVGQLVLICVGQRRPLQRPWPGHLFHRLRERLSDRRRRRGGRRAHRRQRPAGGGRARPFVRQHDVPDLYAVRPARGRAAGQCRLRPDRRAGLPPPQPRPRLDHRRGARRQPRLSLFDRRRRP